MGDKLLPCQCGDEPSVERRNGGSVVGGKWYRERVYCRNKKCTLTTAQFKRPGQAIKAWNTRTDSKRIAELEDGLRDIGEMSHRTENQNGAQSGNNIVQISNKARALLGEQS